MCFFQNVSGSGKDMGQAYVNFTRNCMDQIRSKVNDELWILNFFEVRYILSNAVWYTVRSRRDVGLMLCLLQQWYTAQIHLLCNWLSERLDHSLHLYQCTCLAHVVKVSVSCIICTRNVNSQGFSFSNWLVSYSCYWVS
jgi:hypothetical protein